MIKTMSNGRGSSMGGMLALGMGVGASIGAATYNIGMWVAIGVAVGVGAAGPTTGGQANCLRPNGVAALLDPAYTQTSRDQN